ncbi:MAG: DNA mismatch repair protein MutS [Labrys sp. (in: a-proteobacteria)]
MDAPTPRSSPDAARPTPMMEQYIEIKAANPDALLFYRMGDFYELFFADAEIASRALGIVLTKRGKHLGEDIPMCGVPVVRADEYLNRLIGLGHRVAVCEQVEDPAEARKRGGKAVVRRDVVRLVTPGTITEETLLDPARANVLLAVARQKLSEGDAGFGLAWLDISTGEFRVTETRRSGLAAEIERIDPREIILPDSLTEDGDLSVLWRGARAAVTPVARDGFDLAAAPGRVAAYFGVATLDGFGSFSRVELAAAAGALAYVERTQKGARPPLDPPRQDRIDAAMAIDAATRANLELTRTLAGSTEGSLLAVIDRTVTPAGSRLLAQWLATPTLDLDRLGERHDAVGFLAGDPRLRGELRARLKAVPDLARALARLQLERGGPRDLAALGRGLRTMAEIRAVLAGLVEAPTLLGAIASTLARPAQAIAERIAAALAEEIPLMARDGGFVRAGYDADLDETRALRDESRRVIAALQTRYVDMTGLRQLKVKHNNLIGYFVEVPQQAGETLLKPPLRDVFAHRQTMAGTMRFSTGDLIELESKIASAADRALAIEMAVFAGLAADLLADQAAIKAAGQALAMLDVVAALGHLAEEEGWTRPRLDRSLAFAIEGGRHPVVERALKQDGVAFIANDCDIGGADLGRIWLLTGPNMAGKSTFLRQNAVIAILAQIGSFVPARSAHIGLVDRLFSRVGAADDLARGRSTFMVEMVETAAILNQAGPRALVILDEIGRGTATFDGLSIAWATIETLHDVNRCRTLFATHYHELTQLAKTLPRIANATMRVTEWQGDVVFLHEVAPGAADRSYGIQVAKLAGLPDRTIERARHVLEQLEATDRQSPTTRLVDDLPLFAAAPRAATPPRRDPVAEALDAIDPNDLTPRQALETLFALKLVRDGAKRKAT